MKVRHIYIIGSQRGPFKIGITTSLQDRLSGIQTGSHAKVAVIWSLPVEGHYASCAEKLTHKALSNYRLSGEWFDVPSVKAQAAIMRAAGQAKRKIQEDQKLVKEPVRGVCKAARRAELLEQERICALHAQRQAEASKQYRLKLASLMQGMAALAAATGTTPAKADTRRLYGLVDEHVRQLRGLPPPPVHRR